MKQKNKPHKKHKKAVVDKGRGIAKQMQGISTVSEHLTVRKADGLNQKRQKREHNVGKLKPSAGMHPLEVSKVACLIPFHESVDLGQIWQDLTGGVFNPDVLNYAVVEMRSQRVQLVCSANRALDIVLDLCKTVDCVIALFSASLPVDGDQTPAFDPHGYRMLTALKYQGFPTGPHGVTGVMCGGEKSKLFKDRAKTTQRYFHSEFDHGRRFYQIYSPDTARHMLTMLCGSREEGQTYRQGRGYMLADGYEYDPASGLLAVKGFARGEGFATDHAVHITGHGNFALQKIVLMDGSGRVLAEAQSPLDLTPLREPDMDDVEQTWPTVEELFEAKRKRVRVPKGVGRSDVEVAWFGEEVGSDAEASEGKEDAASELSDHDYGSEDDQTMTPER